MFASLFSLKNLRELPKNGIINRFSLLSKKTSALVSIRSKNTTKIILKGRIIPNYGYFRDMHKMEPIVLNRIIDGFTIPKKSQRPEKKSRNSYSNIFAMGAILMLLGSTTIYLTYRSCS